MRHFVISFLMAALAAQAPFVLAQAGQAPQAVTSAAPQTVVGTDVVRADAAGLSGVVTTPEGEPIRNTVVQARNLLTNEIDGSARTNDIGEYVILNLQPGNYVLEIVDDDGAVIGTSAYVAATAGAVVSGLTVTAASGVLSAVGSATGLVATLGATAARGVTAVAAAAGAAGTIPGVIAAAPIASPSR